MVATEPWTVKTVVLASRPMLIHLLCVSNLIVCLVCAYLMVSERRLKKAVNEAVKEAALCGQEASRADAARVEMEGRIHHLQHVFVPSVMNERQKWYDLYIDAITTYGNAQNIYERAIESLAKRANAQIPLEARQMMKLAREKAAQGKATPKLIVQDGPKPILVPSAPDPNKTPTEPPRVA